MAYPGASEATALSEMLSGATAPFFWAEIVGGLVVPFCILVFAKNRENMKLVTISSVLVVLGVACKRIWLLLTSFINPNIFGAPGITSGTKAAVTTSTSDIWMTLGTYTPTWAEYVIVIGVISLGILAVMLLSRKLLTTDGAGKTHRETAHVSEPQVA